MQERLAASSRSFLAFLLQHCTHTLLFATDSHPERRAPGVRRVARDSGLHCVRWAGRDAEGSQAGAAGRRGGPAEGARCSHRTHHEPDTGGTRQ